MSDKDPKYNYAPTFTDITQDDVDDLRALVKRTTARVADGSLQGIDLEEERLLWADLRLAAGLPQQDDDDS